MYQFGGNVRVRAGYDTTSFRYRVYRTNNDSAATVEFQNAEGKWVTVPGPYAVERLLQQIEALEAEANELCTGFSAALTRNITLGKKIDELTAALEDVQDAAGAALDV